MPREDQSNDFLHAQKIMGAILAHLYIIEQQKAAEQVPHGWQALTIPNFGATGGAQIVPSQPRRGKIKLWNDGPSDLLIAPNNLTVETVKEYLTAQPGQVVNCVVVKNGGDPVELDTTGAIFGIPVGYGQGSQNVCNVRLHATMFTLSITGNPPNVSQQAENFGHKWAGLSGEVGDITALL